MRPAFAHLGLALVLVAGPAVRALAQDKPAEGPSPRERWEHLSDEERERMRQRFEALQRMSPEERRAVMERFERMRTFERGARDELSDEGKRELSELDPQAQRDAVRGLVERELCERGRSMREHLPHEWREAFERATPPERERMLAKFQEHVRGERSEHLLHDLARRLDLAPAEVERIRALPPNEQGRELMGLERRAIEHDIETRGLPPWLPAAEWETWRALDTPQFIERWHGRMRQLGFERFGPPPEGNAAPAAPGAVNAQGPDPERVHELFERLHPDPRWFTEPELSKLDRQARRETIEARMRERALEWLDQSPDLIAPDALARLKTLHGRDFFEGIRDCVRGLPRPPCPQGPPPDGSGGPGGPRQHEHGPRPPPGQPPGPPPGDHPRR